MENKLNQPTPRKGQPNRGDKMRASDQINVNILKRHILGEIELQGGFHNIRQCSSVTDLSAIAWARNWIDGHCYGEKHGEDAIYQLYSEMKERARLDDE